MSYLCITYGEHYIGKQQKNLEVDGKYCKINELEAPASKYRKTLENGGYTRAYCQKNSKPRQLNRPDLVFKLFHENYQLRTETKECKENQTDMN